MLLCCCVLSVLPFSADLRSANHTTGFCGTPPCLCLLSVCVCGCCVCYQNTTKIAREGTRERGKKTRENGRGRIWPILIWPLSGRIWANLTNFCRPNLVKPHLAIFLFLVGWWGGWGGWAKVLGPQGVGARPAMLPHEGLLKVERQEFRCLGVLVFWVFWC